jgi:hypothetical protein
MITLQNNSSITTFFAELFKDLNCQQDTKAYIVGIFTNYKSAKHDLSQDSLTLLLCQAHTTHNFSIYQNIGDWVFFIESVAPQYLQSASKDYYESLARTSYYTCYRLINKQWKVFEEMSDQFPILEKQVKEKLTTLNMNQTSVGNYIVPFGF